MVKIVLEMPELLHEAAESYANRQGFTDIGECIRHLLRREVPLPITNVKEKNMQESENAVGVIHAQNRPMITYISWRRAVLDALGRYCGRHQSQDVYRHRILQEELDEMVSQTQSRGRTPEMTFNRVMQELRDEGLVEFVNNNGHYKYRGILGA